jgi:gamma-glutamyltranspeptidase
VEVEMEVAMVSGYPGSSLLQTVLVQVLLQALHMQMGPRQLVVPPHPLQSASQPARPKQMQKRHKRLPGSGLLLKPR